MPAVPPQVDLLRSHHALPQHPNDYVCRMGDHARVGHQEKQHYHPRRVAVVFVETVSRIDTETDLARPNNVLFRPKYQMYYSYMYDDY